MTPVLDSSVVIAMVRNEVIDELAYKIIQGAVMSAVNIAEVYTKLASWNMHATPAVDALLATLVKVEAFTPTQAHATGMLWHRTRHAGLSLGDRACLALALELGVPAYTTDRNWLRVDVGCAIHCLR